MQITFETKRGTVELSLRKLNLFRRVRVLEDKEEALLQRVKALEKMAEACPYQNRAAEPAETSPASHVESKEAGEAYTASDLFTEWTEGEDVAKQRREERRQMSEEKAKRGGSGA